MDIYTIDFETYYDKEYSLSKMTTEAYVRDPRFETILCGIKRNNEPAYWVSAREVSKELRSLNLDDHCVLAHHAHFDGLILSHHYGITPKVWLDTLSMARALHGTKGGNSLAKLSVRYGLGEKGHEVVLAMGKHRTDFTKQEIDAYGSYCVNDCDLTFKLMLKMRKAFSDSELKQIDAVIRMFTEPVLELDPVLLQEYVEEQRNNKVTALIRAGVQMGDVMSNEKFAEALRFYGVEPPTKISATTGKQTYAFAKTDDALQKLAEHDDENVQALVAARLASKSTIGETRALRMLGMAERGPACVYLNYYGAETTGRLSGGDKMNWQNFRRGSPLRMAVNAPPGYACVVVDSSNIESRILDWLSGQEDAVEAYVKYDRGVGPDIYCVMAEKIYGKAITKKENPDERQMGKVAKLGLGYGMGWEKFATTVKGQTGRVITPVDANNIVNIYRKAHPQVLTLWQRCEDALSHMLAGSSGEGVDFRGVVRTDPGGLVLPSGLLIRYPDLRYEKRNYSPDNPSRGGYSYFNGREREYLWGGKVTENIIQALARIVVMEQTMELADRWTLVLSVHDEAVFCVREKDAQKCLQEAVEAFRKPLAWCQSLPLNSEGGYHQSYGKAKK